MDNSFVNRKLRSVAPDGGRGRRTGQLGAGAGIPPAFNAYAHPMNDVFSNLSLKTVCAGVIGAILDSIVFSAPSFGLTEDSTLR